MIDWEQWLAIAVYISSLVGSGVEKPSCRCQRPNKKYEWTADLMMLAHPSISNDGHPIDLIEQNRSSRF